MDETTEMPRVKFGGTNGPEHEELCLKIEHRFDKLLCWLHHISPKILDVRQSTWYDDMALFRSEILKLEITVENLMEKTFKRVGNIEEAIQALHGFRYFMQRANLQKQFDKKTTAVSIHYMFPCLS